MAGSDGKKSVEAIMHQRMKTSSARQRGKGADSRLGSFIFSNTSVISCSNLFLSVHQVCVRALYSSHVCSPFALSV